MTIMEMLIYLRKNIHTYYYYYVSCNYIALIKTQDKRFFAHSGQKKKHSRLNKQSFAVSFVVCKSVTKTKKNIIDH